MEIIIMINNLNNKFKFLDIKNNEQIILSCCATKLYKYETCICKEIKIIQKFIKKYNKKLYFLQKIYYNKSTICYYDINSFNLSTRDKNDSNNKKRENIIGCIINNILPTDYYKYSFRWNKLKLNIDGYIKKLYEEQNVKNIQTIQCIHKSGRNYHYDFQVIINKNIYFNVEFKFNAENVNQTPQFVSPMKPSQYLTIMFEKYYYENGLSKLSKYIKVFPSLEEYCNKIHSPNPKCVLDLQTKYYQGCIKSSKYTGDEEDIRFYNETNYISNKTIREFISISDLDIDKLSKYLLETQKNKYYMLYKNGNIYLQKINIDNYIIIDYIKEANRHRYIAKTKSGIQMKILLRWKNGNGIAYPAFQIS